MKIWKQRQRWSPELQPLPSQPSSALTHLALSSQVGRCKQVTDAHKPGKGKKKRFRMVLEQEWFDPRASLKVLRKLSTAPGRQTAPALPAEQGAGLAEDSLLLNGLQEVQGRLDPSLDPRSPRWCWRWRCTCPAPPRCEQRRSCTRRYLGGQGTAASQHLLQPHPKNLLQPLPPAALTLGTPWIL